MFQFILVVLLFLFVGLLILAGTLGLGIGAGYVVHWLFPAIDLGAAMVAGVITGCVASYLTFKLWRAAMTYDPNMDENDEDDEPYRRPIFIVEPPTLGRKKRRKSS